MESLFRFFRLWHMLPIGDLHLDENRKKTEMGLS